jgi:hydroxymethylpyrimidine/phosphomethylpyrimidine kinase
VAEVELLTGISVTTPQQRGAAADRLLAMGAGAVLIKGGHLPLDFGAPGAGAEDNSDEVTDLLRTLDGDEYLIARRRLGGPGFRGTGCCLAAAIAGFVAEGSTLRAAVESARDHLHRAMQDTLTSASPLMMQVPLELTHALRGAPLVNASDSGPRAFAGRPA